ncbi:spermidine/putrescine ABC transporter substrate-binding protein [Komagataeibacter kakiaceti JCM 25156]
MPTCSRRGRSVAVTTALIIGTVLGSGLGATVGAIPARAADDALNVLTWCDHEDPELLTPFEQANNVRIHFKDIDGTDAISAILRQSQAGDWDVVIMDETDAPRLAAAGLLAPLDPADFPAAEVPAPIAAPAMGSYRGQLYSVPEKYDYNAVAFNQARVDAADMDDINAIWQPRYHGRLAIYDSYLPVLSYIALALGRDPAHLEDADLPALHARLAALRANAALVDDMAGVQQALASGDVDIVVGGGAWTTAGVDDDGDVAAGASTRAAARTDLTFTVPRQGAMRWQHGISIIAASQRKALALAFARYLRTPAAQARLATSSCYRGMPASPLAPLDPADRTALHWDDQPAYIAASHPYPVMDRAMDGRLRALWDDVMKRGAATPVPPPVPAPTGGMTTQP